MYKILASIDGSVYARSVCDHAAWLAQRTGYAIELMHVITRPNNDNADHDLSGSIGLGARSALLDELSDLDKQRAKLAVEHGRALLADAKQRIQAAGVNNVTTVLRHDELSDALSDLDPAIKTIIIGKRGQSADFATLHVGSNLERVARSCDLPVFVASRAFKPISKALLAFDGGHSTALAVAELIRNDSYADIGLQLLYVGTVSSSLQKSLDETKERLSSAGYQVEVIVKEGTVETVIADHVSANNIDLLLMGAYGHSRIRHMLIGSTTTEMLRSCLVPVILFR